MSELTRSTAAPEPPRRRPGRPRLTEPSPEYVQRLDDIIETGIRVFHERGYDAGTLDDVAAALDLRRASLYHYLRSKGELLYLIFDRAITVALARLDEISTIHEPSRQIAEFIAHQVRMVGQDPGLFAVAWDQRVRIEKEFKDKILDKEREYLHRVTAMVERATTSGDLPETDGRQAAHALIGMTSWLYKWFDPERDDAEAIARTMIRLIFGERLDADAVLNAAVEQKRV